MPYDYPDNVPEYAKSLPAEAQKLCVAAYNSTYELTQDEDKSRTACWGAVKTGFEHDAEGEWVPKAKEMSEVNLEELATVQKAHAMHNRLHAEYLDARHTPRKKSQIQKDHETVVRRIVELGGRHIPKGDALDGTLPEEFRESPKLRYIGDTIVLSEGEPSRSEIQVLRTGVFHHSYYGKFTITEETLQTMVRNFNETRPEPPTEMVVDWEHMSTADPPQRSPAAGWVKSLNAKGDGLFALVEWTEEAAEEIRKKEYRFISPEFVLDYKDKETGKGIGPTLLSVALTNRPFLEGMEPVVLSESLGAMVFSEEATLDKIEDAAARRAGAEDYSESQRKEEDIKMEKQLREILELGEGGDVPEAVIALKAKAEESTKLQAKIDELQGTIQAAEKKSTEVEADKAVEDALQQGKIIPKMKEWAKAYILRDPEGFKAFVEMTMKAGPDLTIKGEEGESESIQLTETEIKVGEKLGVSKEQLIEDKRSQTEQK